MKHIKNLLLLGIVITAALAVPRLNRLVTRSVYGEDILGDSGASYALIALSSSNLSISLSKFFTDPSLNPLPVDSFGNPKVEVIFKGNTVESTNPGEVLAWIKVTNTGLTALQSLATNETVAIDWVINPKWMPSTDAIHSFFQFTNGSKVEITDPSSISVTTGNPQTVLLKITNVTGTKAGKSLAQNESILLSVKLLYGLIGTNQSIASYPINYSDIASASAWTGVNFSGAPTSSSNSAFFVAYACGIACPGDMTVGNDPGQCGAMVTYPAPLTNGTGCGTVTCSPASGSLFPVGTTTVNCSDPGGASCSFTVTVKDITPPTITCPATVTAVTDQNACAAPACQVVNFPAPVASDNCPGVTVVCNPPSGSCFPIGPATVTCTATDASGNTAMCSFTITTFDVALQDDSDPSIILLWNSLTGAYRFCCHGITFTGVGTSTIKGCVFTLQHNPADRRVLGRVDKAVHSGTASLQAPPGTIRCTITDRNTLNDTNLGSCH